MLYILQTRTGKRTAKVRSPPSLPLPHSPRRRSSPPSLPTLPDLLAPRALLVWRGVQASVAIAVDMVKEGLITEPEALLRIDAERMTHFLHPTIDPQTPKARLASSSSTSSRASSPSSSVL